MPRKKTQSKVNKKDIIAAFVEIAKERGIDRDLIQGKFEDMLRILVRKKYGEDAEPDIIVNMDRGDIEIYLPRTVVNYVLHPAREISLSEVRRRTEGTDETYEVGDEYIEEISLDNISKEFGRQLIMHAKQVLSQQLRDIEKNNIFLEYEQKIGEIIVGEIYQIRRNEILILHNKHEVRMPAEEQIPTERYKKNSTIRAIIKEVRRASPSSMPDIIVSRADERFLARLFEIEIPEVYDGIVEIKAIAREPGERAKVAVISYDDRVDPVGACIGMKGIRINAIVREVSGETIDVIEWSDDPVTLIARALSPAKVRQIQVDTENKTATVTVPDDQVSLAIGRNGQNVRLASRLTGYTLTLVKEGSEDIELIEFRDDIGRELYEHIIEAHIDTAREFLDADLKKLLRIPGMTPERLLAIRKIILEEFNEKELPDIKERIEIAQIQLEEAAEKSSADLGDEIEEMFNEYEVEAFDESDEEEGFTASDEASAPRDEE
ncbi:MAG: transcription termination/antitermination protein NusA [Candidatus Kapaibacterium sp.]|nr:MAG: transcription termination/antitermination protein NusA [Candidatus Kapabacteria bacterium]